MQSINFQIIDWYSNDMYPSLSESDDSDSDEPTENKYSEDESEYKIFLFGKDMSGKSYSLMVNDFTPYFYIQVPDNFKSSQLPIFEKWVKYGTYGDKNNRGMWAKYRNSLLRCTLHKKMRFRGFTNKKQFKFIRLVFKSHLAMKSAIGLFQNKSWDPIKRRVTSVTPKEIIVRGVTKSPFIYHLYENMIDPMVRFIHHKRIKPANWVSCKKTKTRTFHPSHCDYNLECNWNNVKPYETTDTVPISIMSFDIECDSSHGDFPLPKKDYLKLAREIVIEYERIQKVIQNDKTNSNVPIYKTYIKNKVKFGKECLKQAFGGENADLNISKVYTKYNKMPTMNNLDLAATKMSNDLPIYSQSMKSTDRNKLIGKSIGAINDDILSPILPPLEGDKTIQIGCSFLHYGDKRPYKNVMYTLEGCSPVKDTIVKSFKNERDLLVAFRNLIISQDPDVITGYNTIGFDSPWLWKRAEELDIEDVFCQMSKLVDYKSNLIKKQSKSSNNELVSIEYVDIPGRIQLDILKLVQKGFNLNSYKLDNVAAEFIQGQVLSVENKGEMSHIKTNNLKGLNKGNFIIFKEIDGYLEGKYKDGKKFEIVDIIDNNLVINGDISLKLDTHKCTWCLGKDDVSPKDIFRLQKGTDDDRQIVAKYCMMDVILCIELLLKLELLTNCIGMANVCFIPLGWSIERGQGIKILSLVSYILKDENFLLPYLYKDTFDNESFEGAIVLKPNPGIYIDNPVAVLDYASLYPSSIIMGNVSHETIVIDDEWMGEEGGNKLKELGYGYYDVTFDTFEITYTSTGAVRNKIKNGEKTVRYVQYKDGKKGIIPTTLEKLLNQRKKTRTKIKYKTIITKNKHEYIGLLKRNETTTTITMDNSDSVTIDNVEIISIADTYSDFQKSVLESEQLSYKITANSVYGNLGAKFSDISFRDLAASTTAIGREQLEIAQKYCENEDNYIKTLDNGTQIKLKNKIIYGDTDSVFVTYDCRYGNGEKMRGRDARVETLRLAKLSEKGIKKILIKPQDLEYEKIFDPFILFTKKKYTGDKYEFDMDKSTKVAMGIVLKRRDNAPIVKMIFGGAIDKIMKDKTIQPSIDFIHKTINGLIDGKYPLDSLIISKTLSSYYKDPDRIAHKVLADRIASRDPGNKPQVNDRIPFVYFNTKGRRDILLQGDKIETPTYIIENNLQPDYEFYITNQIMNPVSQIYALCLENIKGYVQNIDNEFVLMERKFINKGKTESEAIKKVIEKKQKIAGKLVFGDILRKLENKRRGNIEISNWFGISNNSKQVSTRISNKLCDLQSDSDEFETDSDDYV